MSSYEDYRCDNPKCNYFEEYVFSDYTPCRFGDDFFEDPGGHVVSIDMYYKNGSLCCPSCDQPLTEVEDEHIHH